MQHETRALVRAAAAGDQRAWAVLHRRYDRLVRHVVRGFGLDAAASEELVQATWCRLVEHIGGLRRPECIASWLGRTARNECLQALRRSARELPTDGDALEALAGGEHDPGPRGRRPAAWRPGWQRPSTGCATTSSGWCGSCC